MRSQLNVGKYTRHHARYCWWKKSCTSWGWQFLPLYTRFYTSQVVQDFFHQQYDYIRKQIASLTSAQLSDQLLFCSTFPSWKRSYLAHLLITGHLAKLSYVPFALVANVLFFLVSRHPLTFLNGHENCDHCATSWRAQSIPQKSSLQKDQGPKWFRPSAKK